MFRLRPVSLLLALVAVATCASGCRHVLYRDMYSDRRSHFVPPTTRVPDLPPEMRVANTTQGGTGIATPTRVGATVPDATTPPTVAPAPATPPSPAAIPGLEPLPGSM